MKFVESDVVQPVEKDTTPNYTAGNPIWKVAQAIENAKFAAELECYELPSVQYLFQFQHLELYGPAGGASNGQLHPINQLNKEDFQKQNIKTFTLGDCYITRGWAQAGTWRGPFLKFSYRGGLDSVLSKASQHQLGEEIKLWFRIGNHALNELLRLPYNTETDRYELELWGYDGNNLFDVLDEKGKAALQRGSIIVRPDIVKGKADDFARDNISDLLIAERFTDHAMHPVLPLHLELAFCNKEENVWDSKNGGNYHFEFSMVFRGWKNFLSAGISANPHGGVGFLEYRNLMSNYFGHKRRPEIGRNLKPWNLDAYGNMTNQERYENFMAVEYMDLHILRPSCGIGIHRHRDNQEIFFMMEGQGLMIVGDWNQHDNRERCFEVRTLCSGDMTLCKTGQLHALLNLTDMDCKLFMFGGYD